MNNTKIKVLYVEDEAITRSFLRDVLQQDSIEVFTAKTVPSAIAAIDESVLAGCSFDVIVLDWWVQDPDDYEMKTTESVLRHLSENRIMALTVVYTSDSEVDESKTLGVPVIRKGNHDFLKRNIERIINEKKNLLLTLKSIRSSINKIKAL